MKSAQIRRMLSTLIAEKVVTDALRKIPSLTGVPSTEAMASVFDGLKLTYRPTNTFGILVDNIYAELGPNPTEDRVREVFVEMCDECPSQIAPTLDSISDKIAMNIGSSYGVVREALIPAAEGMVSSIHDKLFDGSDLNVSEIDQSVAMETFEWGVLKDPVVVNEAMILAREEANIFKPEQTVRPYFIDSCFAAASRHVPKKIGSEERAMLKDKLHEKYPDMSDRDLISFSGFFCDANGYGFYANSLKPAMHNSAKILDASKTLDRLHAMNEMLHGVISEDPTLFSDQLKSNINECGKSVSLMLGGLQAARDSYYNDTAVMDRTVDGGQVKSMVLNGDVAVQAASEDLSVESFGIATEMQMAKGIEFSNRGVTLTYTRKHLENDTKAFNSRAEERAKTMESQDTIDFGRAVKSVVASAVPEFLKDNDLKVNTNDLRVSTENLASHAMRAEEKVTDLLVQFLANLTGNKQVTGLMTAMESVNDDDNEARSMAFARYALGMITGERYAQ